MSETKKPFVAPQLKEEASLAEVTLLSGGGITRHSSLSSRHGHDHGHGHGHGH